MGTCVKLTITLKEQWWGRYEKRTGRKRGGEKRNMGDGLEPEPYSVTGESQEHATEVVLTNLSFLWLLIGLGDSGLYGKVSLGAYKLSWNIQGKIVLGDMRTRLQ